MVLAQKMDMGSVVSSRLLSLRVGGCGWVYIAITEDLVVTHLYAQLGGTERKSRRRQLVQNIKKIGEIG